MIQKNDISASTDDPNKSNSLSNNSISPGESTFFNKRNFTILSVVVCVLMIFLSLDFGINGDERFQVDYSKKLWSYYSTLGKDTAALHDSLNNMHLYGGLFDLTAVSVNHLIGYQDEFTPEYHSIRRVLCALFGFLILLFTSLFAKQIGGWPLAFITFLFLLLSPRFFGDAMVNPKDIPFAAGYIIALYFIARYIRELPKPGVGSMIGIILGILIALNTRAGGLLLIAYLFLFVAVYIFMKFYREEPLTSKDITRIVLYTFGVGLLSYFAGIIFWPFALADPFLNPFKALTEFTNQPILITVLFGGIHMVSSNLPWSYLPEWIIMTIPLFSIFGILFLIRLFKQRLEDLPLNEISILIFSFLFPIVYTIFKHSTLHDGWRHFIFVYPPLLLLSSLGWFLWFTSFRSTVFKAVSIVLLIGLLSENLYAIISLHPYQYTYFSPFLGGIKKAYGNFETDYWMLSIKEAVSWLKKHEKIERDSKSYIIATNCMYPAQVYLADSSHKNKVTYTRYYERSSKKWDYALFYSRFVDRSQLLNHSWPPKGTIHIIEANGVPLCAIVKRENQEDFLGFEALKKNDMNSAIRHFTASLEYAPNNESVSMALADIYKNNCQYDKAEKTIQQSLNAYPENPVALSLQKSILAEKQKQ